MKIIITGGAGFLGQRLAQQLLAHHGESVSILLVDRVTTDAFAADRRVQSAACDITDEAALARLLTPDTAIVYHLAAIVSGQAEAEFDLGMKINLEATRTLLEICRRLPAPPKFLFTSSLAVFGGELPAVITDQIFVCPQSSYGAEKAVGELLVNEYSRRGFVDGRVLRLPTITVRPGKPNRAASSFVSGIIREPLNGEPAICPVGREVLLWISSPATAVGNLRHAHLVPAAALGKSRTINLPGLSVTVGEMIDTLERIAGREVAARIRSERDEAVERIVTSWPGRFETPRALALGFQRDDSFEAIVRHYQREMVSTRQT
ncbi:D-erythronate dehydrogenase [uncultured Defluviicoccus sp.]|uniref:D-erythronate dehydrogenase n=1 Tax=metagenome TaxID=256318 RepID=A0A380TEV9_9ZZZZ|nr:D-erythronate dehydrogenase [uncultured Defluviicoccus sp.]